MKLMQGIKLLRTHLWRGVQSAFNEWEVKALECAYIQYKRTYIRVCMLCVCELVKWKVKLNFNKFVSRRAYKLNKCHCGDWHTQISCQAHIHTHTRPILYVHTYKYLFIFIEVYY